MTHLISKITDTGCSFSISDSSGVPIPIERWSAIGSSEHFGAIATIDAALQADTAEISSDGIAVIMTAATLVGLDDETAAMLGLPGPVPYILQVDAIGALGTLRLEPRWLNGKLRLRNTVIRACFLEVDGESFRLVSPFFETLERIAEFNQRGSSTPAEQARAWADIQELIGLEPKQIRPGGFLERMRVARANRFSLDFVPGEDGGFQIAPVPLVTRPTNNRSSEFSLADSDTQIEPEPQRLLSSSEQERFQQAFHSRSEVQGQYLGGNDVYVLLSPEVKRSLEVVRRIQDRPAAERLEFARNPYPFLKQQDGAGEVPFSESRSFSDRVTGLGILERVTLPWQILGSQGWIPPERVPVQFGNVTIDFEPSKIEPAIVDIEHAIAERKQTAKIGDAELPATNETRDALLEARANLDQRANREIAEALPAEPKLQQGRDRIGLQVRRNLDEAEYAARSSERSRVTFDLPEMDSRLKKHQADAVRWLQQRWMSGRRGALLADDMGLGKTLSALSFMVWLRAAMQSNSIRPRPILIVAPVSLLDNWQAEHKRHIGSSPSAFVDIVKAYGSDLPRRAPGRDIETGAAMLNIDEMIVDRFGYPTCVLTTYETLRDYQQSFASVQFALVVLDEAQRVKNPASLGWHAVSALNSDFWLALTGTPVENRLADLWAIADILEPSFLGSLKSFSKQYESGFDEESLKKLKLLIEKSEDGAPFMLRRLKEQVLDGIPQKHEHLHPLPMPEVQSAAYNDIVSSAHDKTAPKQMLAIVQQLRETSLHPLKPLDCSPETYIAASARFQSLFRILDEIRDQGEKVLIFLDRNVIEAYLARLILQRYELPELPPIINGDVPGSKRQLLVDGFQKRSGFGVMILSPKAGGVGLTLTAANHVIHLSRWWNPAVEDQSTDRVYRIGQQKPVHVHYVQAILPGQPGQSFDERLHLLLQKKRRMSRDLLWPFDSEASDAAELLGK